MVWQRTGPVGRIVVSLCGGAVTGLAVPAEPRTSPQPPRARASPCPPSWQVGIGMGLVWGLLLVLWALRSAGRAGVHWWW